MARTKSSVGSKVAAGKSSKARVTASTPSVVASTGSSGRKKSTRDYSSGNPACPRETPKWQRPISNFLIIKNKENVDREAPGTSDAIKKCKRINVIESDEEEDTPRNSVLEESFDLEPLSGEKCHKLQEYYNKHKSGRANKNGDEENVNVDEENDIDNVDEGNDIDNVDEGNNIDNVDEGNDIDSVATDDDVDTDKENKNNGRKKRDLDSSGEEGATGNKKVRVDIH